VQDGLVFFSASSTGGAEESGSGRPPQRALGGTGDSPAGGAGCAMLVVTDAKAAAMFNNLRQRQILLALIDKECSLGELAKATQTSLNLLHHHIRRLMSFGLVTISGTRKRAGTPVKLYRASARAFFVPADLAGAPTEPLNEKLRGVLEQSLAGTYRGVLFAHDGTDAKMSLIWDEKFGAGVSELWAELALSEAEAAAVAHELGTILRRHAGRSGKGRRRYIVHAAVAPW
jgi:DNA-binding transcriptional ArsR family regulator